MTETMKNIISESLAVKQKVLNNEAIHEKINEAVIVIAAAYEKGNKVMFDGKGGSAGCRQT